MKPRRTPSAPLALLALALTCATACEATKPWEDLAYREVDLAAVQVFRAPDERLCGFLDARFNTNGTVLSPGTLSCDDGALGKTTVLATGPSGEPGALVPGPVAPAAIFGGTLYRFEPTSGALRTSAVDTRLGPVVGVDGSGRTLHAGAGRLVRREADGAGTTLLSGALQGELLVAPNDRLYLAPPPGTGALLVELSDGGVTPVAPCPGPALPTDCASRWVHGFDARGALYFSFLGQADGGVSFGFARVDPDRTLHRLPDGPATPRLNGGVAPCSVTAGGTVVCAYRVEDSEEDNAAHHVELIFLSPGAARWVRVGKIPGSDSSAHVVAARERGDCLVGPYSGGFGHLLELRGYRFR